MKQMKLVLRNGMEFTGVSCGSDKTVVGEIVFNTSMVGYQEIISDPAYSGQIVVMTYPLMGQYGITDDDFESRTPSIGGLVVRECCNTPSNFRYTKTLSEELDERGIPCLSGPDTRMITRIIRDEGCMTAALVDECVSHEDAMALIAAYRPKENPVSEVSCSKRWFSRTPHHKFDIVVVDCGLKHSVIAELNRRSCNVTVVPFDASLEDILSFNPDGLLISNGPGSPDSLPDLIDVVRKLRGKLPIFGICLGQNIVSLACGAGNIRLKAGHHGGRPVRESDGGRIISAEHNHNWTVDPDTLEGSGLEVSYSDVSDGSIEGLVCRKDRICTVQFYPEGAPGPRESHFFDDFIKAMED